MTIKEQLKQVLYFHKHFEKYRDNYIEITGKSGIDLFQEHEIEIEKRNRIYKRELYVLSEKVGGLAPLAKIYKELISQGYIELKNGNYYITLKGEGQLNKNVFWDWMRKPDNIWKIITAMIIPLTIYMFQTGLLQKIWQHLSTYIAK